jgi:hypothetical protein
VHKNKTKEDDNERQFIVVFFGCIKQNKTRQMTSVGLSSSSLGAQKQNKMTTSVGSLLSSLGA